MEISQNVKDFIIELSNEMRTQDTRCTAQPYALVLRVKEEQLLPNGYGEYKVCIYDGEKYSTPEELADFFDIVGEYGSFDEVIDALDNNDDYCIDRDDFDIFDARTTDIIDESNVNFFLTEKAYNEHINANGHNLNMPSNYGIHLFRNREMDKLYESIHHLAEAFRKEET